NATGEDGIVDFAYDIATSTLNYYKQDFYPLMDPYGSSRPLIVYAGGQYKAAVNESVEFKGIPVGGSPPYSFYWDFGDGYN
ncbi:unnamed protein product, partial [marine sediment metagenome]